MQTSALRLPRLLVQAAPRHLRASQKSAQQTNPLLTQATCEKCGNHESSLIAALFSARRHQNFTLAAARQGTDHARIFHFLEHARGAVVADFQVPLDE